QCPISESMRLALHWCSILCFACCCRQKHTCQGSPAIRNEGCMICPRCGANAASGKKFCGDCGSPLPWQCRACGSENPSDKRFCGDCGAAQAAGPAGLPERPPVAAAPTPERRQLTVMFTDLVGSTALGTRLDPEDLREVISAYHLCVAGIVARFGGFVAHYVGD